MTVVFLVIAIALIFEYINGFHDTANSIATVVGTKVLTPRQAIVLAATTNLLGAFTGIAVAKTISSGLVGAEFVTQGTLVCALLAGIIWNLITWWFGMPSSSSHALVGGLVGSVPWVVFTCALTMAAGTAAGGWKIIKTMGHKMVKLQPVNGFAAETTAATVLYVTGTLGMPVSTTHAITTSIMGVGCAKRFSALKLGVVERILWAWVMTLPATGGLAFALVFGLAKIGVIKL